MNTTKNVLFGFALVLAGCDAGTSLPTPEPPALTGKETRDRVVHDLASSMNVLLDESTVLCSSADYSATFLKVLIPQIAGVTVFDHTNAGAGAPCIAAGECSETLRPGLLIEPEYPYAPIQLRVLRTEHDEIDHDARTCTATLTEQLFTTIRGVPFTHERQGAVTRSYEDCR